MTSGLSDEFKIACEIYKHNQANEPIWYSKLKDIMSTHMDANTVSMALNVLFDWGIIKAEYGGSESGKAAKLLYVSESAEPIIEELYRKYWSGK